MLFSQSLSVFFRLFQRPSLFDSFARTHTYAHTLSHWLICLFSSSTVQIEVMALGNCSNCHLAFWWERWGEESTLLGVILCLSPVSVFAPSLGPLSYLILTWKDLLVQLFLSKCQTQMSTVHQKTPLFSLSYCLSCLQHTDTHRQGYVLVKMCCSGWGCLLLSRIPQGHCSTYF